VWVFAAALVFNIIMMYARRGLEVDTGLVDIFVFVAFIIALPLITSTLRAYYKLDETELVISLGRTRQYKIAYTRIRAVTKISGADEASVKLRSIPRNSVEIKFENDDGQERIVFVSPRKRDDFVCDLETRMNCPKEATGETLRRR